MAKTMSPYTEEAMRKAADRLHHLSMRYVGALLEACTGTAVGLLPKDHPGLRECRDLIDALLFTRAEINGFTKLLHEKGILDLDEWGRNLAEQYEWLCQQKAEFLGVGVDDAGLIFKGGGTPPAAGNGG